MTSLPGGRQVGKISRIAGADACWGGVWRYAAAQAAAGGEVAVLRCG